VQRLWAAGSCDTDSAADALLGLHALRCLALDQLADGGLARLAAVLPALTHLTRLHLDVTGLPSERSASALAGGIASLPRLQHLKVLSPVSGLFGEGKVHSRRLAHVLLPSVLSLRELTALHPRGIPFEASGAPVPRAEQFAVAPQMAELELLLGCGSFVRSLSASLLQLTFLRFETSAWDHDSANGLEVAAAAGALPQLRELQASGDESSRPDRVREARVASAVVAVLAHAPALQVLAIVHVRLNEAACGALAGGLTRLMLLYLRGCGLRDAQVAALAEAPPVATCTSASSTPLASACARCAPASLLTPG
jgi:hypothetical protein